MDSPGEILHLCRLCLVKDQVNVPIFEEQGDIRQISLKISSCLPVKVSRDDKLPKKICDGCSEKLDICYDFWSSSANAEKTLYSWLGQEEEEPPQPEVPKPIQTLVKEERDLPDKAPEESTKDESEAPPRKRARRTAAVKARVNIPQESEDEDLDTAEPFTKVEDDSEGSDNEEKDPSYTEMPGTSADDDQAGPSGVGKDDVEAPEILIIEVESNDSNKVACGYCGKDFSRKTHLDAHVAAIHTKQFRFNCPKCDSGFYNKAGLNRHISNVHDKIFPYQCEVCRRSFKSKNYLSLHMPKHTPGGMPKYKCSNCENTYTYIETLRKHEIRCKGLTVKLKCELCPKTIDSSVMSSHMRTQHSKARHECAICCKKFKAHWYLSKHLAMVHRGEGKVPCDICGKLCSNKFAADAHKRAIHTKEYTAFCDVCGKGFVYVNHLKVHLRKTHRSEEMPVETFSCPVESCTKTYTSRASLKLHLPTHNEEKPLHPCPHCDKVLHHPHSLKVHIMGNHVDEDKRRRYVCKICKKELRSATSLRDHVRTHTGEKPFLCEHCDKTFKTKALLRCHLVVHTKEKPYVCRVCQKGFTQYGSVKGHFAKAHPHELWEGVFKKTI